MDEIRYRPIGTVHSPFKEVKGMPIQPSGAVGIKPYVPDFDYRKVERIGWLSDKSRNVSQQRADSDG